jgi:hypothetical protein
MKTKDNPLTTKLKEWIDNQSDYRMELDYNYSDFSSNEDKEIQIFKKRVFPKRKHPKYGYVVMMRDENGELKPVIGDTHYFVLRVYPQRKFYNVLDNRMFSENETVGLTFKELIKTITDESCGYDYTQVLEKFDGGVQMGINPNGMKPKLMFSHNGKTLTKENMKGMVV